MCRSRSSIVPLYTIPRETETLFDRSARWRDGEIHRTANPLLDERRASFRWTIGFVRRVTLYTQIRVIPKVEHQVERIFQLPNDRAIDELSISTQFPSRFIFLAISHVILLTNRWHGFLIDCLAYLAYYNSRYRVEIYISQVHWFSSDSVFKTFDPVATTWETQPVCFTLHARSWLNFATLNSVILCHPCIPHFPLGPDSVSI